MTTNELHSVLRRDVLKTIGLGAAVGAVGTTMLSGRASADHVPGHPARSFTLYGIDHFTSPNRLVTVESQSLDPGATSPTTVAYTEMSQNVNVNTLASHPTDGKFYSTNLNTGKAFSVDTAGTVSEFGSQNNVLKGIAGSAMIIDENDAPRWYGITHAGASPASTLFEIDLTDGSTTEKGRLFTDGDEGPQDIDATHLGMGVNFLTNELWGVFGDPDDLTYSRVFRVVDIETGEVEIVNDEAITGGRSVGAALGPCANVMYVVRQGNKFYGYDVETDDEYEYGTLQYSGGSPGLNFDSLTVPYGIECETCSSCDLEEPLKYEYMFAEDGELEDELDGEPDLDGFVPEDAPDAFGYDSYDSKDGEDYEPITVYFENPGDYCADTLVATVKAGRVVEEVDVTENEDGYLVVDIDYADSPFVNEKNGKLYAISYVEFSCVEDDTVEPTDETAADADVPDETYPDYDHDRGHGNDPDGYDEDNPGKAYGRGGSARGR